MAVYYITIFTLTGLGYILTEKKRYSSAAAYYPAVVFLLLMLVSSLRYAIGFDYFSYRNFYEQMSGYTFGGILRTYTYEPLFFIVCRVFSLFGCSYPVFLSFINMFLLITVINFIRRFSRLPWISVYLYITLQFLAYHMNLIRQSIALSFFLAAYPYLKARKLLPFTILILIGGLFHNSLWFIYPFYFLLPKKMDRKSVGFLLAATVISYLLFDPLFQFFQPLIPEKYRLYQISYFWNASTVDYIIPAASYGILIYLFRNRIADPVSRCIYQNSALYHFLISLFITRHFILERFAIYPFVFSLIAIPDIIASYQDEKVIDKKHSAEAAANKTFTAVNGSCKIKNTAYGFVTLVFLIFGASYFLFASGKGFHNVYPYISLLDKSLSVPYGQS